MTYPRPYSLQWAHRTIILACLALAPPALPRAFGQAPAASKPSPPLTAKQQDRLKERDQLAMQAEQLRSQGKLPEAIKAAEAMLGIEREVLGETSEDAIGSLELLLQLHQDREDWAAARKAGKEVLNLRSATLPKDHWQVADARWALDNIDTVAKLSDRDRRRLREADRLVQQVEELSARGKYSEATGPAPDVENSRSIAGGAPSRPGPEPERSGALACGAGQQRGSAGVLQAGAGDEPGAVSSAAVSTWPSQPGHQPEQPGIYPSHRGQ